MKIIDFGPKNIPNMIISISTIDLFFINLYCLDTHTVAGRMVYLAMAFFSSKKKVNFPIIPMVTQKVKNCIIPLIKPTAKIVKKSKNKKLCCKPSYQKNVCKLIM